MNEQIDLTGTMTVEEMRLEIARLQSLNASLTVKRTGQIVSKVSAKGAVSVYGLGRFPITLYRSQWERLFTAVDSIRSFINENADKLSEKPTDGRLGR